MTTGFAGDVLKPGDPEYDEARKVFNGLIDRRPARIMRCTRAADVAVAIIEATTAGMPVSVYGGGHGVTGAAVVDGGVCIDLRGLASVDVDAASRTAVIGGGATWRQVDAATTAAGLVVTGGRVPSTGVGGLSLGSGSGWLERKLGFTCDNLISAQVVTAAGDVVTASETENPDLFWAIRGGGGNFGVVTEFTLTLHELPATIYGGMLVYPGFAAIEVIKNWRDFMATAPDEVGGGIALITAPPADFVPDEAKGKPVIGVIVSYAGDPATGAAVCEPLTSFTVDGMGPAVNHVGPMTYVDLQGLIEPGNPHGMHNYWSGDFLAELPDEAIETFVSTTFPPASPLSQFLIIPGGGALSRVPDDRTAFGNRSAPYNTHYLSMWPPDLPDEPNIAKTRAVAAAMKPWSTGHAYLNFIGDEGLLRVSGAYDPETYARLRAIKKVWDPTNVFRHNQNIPPAD